jgi:hypothetical protein
MFNGQYFTQNPEKVLGTIVTKSSTGRLLTDRFNNPRPEVRGTLEDALSRISVAPAPRYSHFKPQETTVPKAQRVLELTASEAAEQQTQPGPSGEVGANVCGDTMVCLNDSIQQYNSNVEYKDANGNTQYYTISREEITIFVTYQVRKGYWDRKAIESSAWGNYLSTDDSIFPNGFASDLTAFDGSEWHPASIFYAGNIYLKVQNLTKQQFAIENVVGAEGYQKILDNLEAVKPKRLRFSIDPTEALIISPFDRIWDEFFFKEDTDGIAFDRPEKVLGVFKRWLRQLPTTDFVADNGAVTSTEQNIRNYWLDGDSFPRTSTLSDSEKATIKRNAQIVGTILFERFCIEGITRDMRVQIEYLFNSTRNHYAQVQYHRIPVGFEINKFFKGGKLVIRPAQREGVAFCASRGTGIVAYDVGVGKTATAILSVEDGFQKGLFKRPLIVTPNGVFWKWVAEIEGTKAEKDIFRDGKKVAKKGDLIGQGILPHRKVNAFYNLGTGITVPRKNGSIEVEKGSITMLTYEGLEKVGFRKDSEKDLISKIVAALSQSEGDREAALREKTAEGWVDKALLNTEYNIEDFGFDAIIVDECHNFRVLFTEVKGDIDSDGDREQKRFFSTGGGQPSGRAIKLFMLNLYIQSKNNGRNTIGLSATPFTNRATEIYSILSLFDYDGLKEFSVNNLSQFCKTFIDETSEAAWTPQGKFDIKYVIRGYNNLPILQTILFRSINYKTGEEANIKRPEKVILPLNKDEKGIPLPAEYVINCRLPNTAEQEEWIKESYLFAGANFRESKIFKTGSYSINDKTKKPDGQVLVALNVARVATFSPYAISLKGSSQYETSKFTAANIVASSPKLEFVMGCIKSVLDHHKSKGTPVSGQIIYSNTGTAFFPFIKDYLVSYIGFADHEVELLTGDTPTAKREKIKAGFQDNTIKVLIGSSAIREGMDLQNHCSVIYNCYFDWNPTDLHQLFGRGWRFGNKFSHVRIVNAMVENSADIFTWQKLSEKISRLSSVWARTGQTKMFEEKELDAEALKRGLITDPEDLAKFLIEEEETLLKAQLVALDAEKKEVEQAIEAQKKLERVTQGLKNDIEAINNYTPSPWWEERNTDRNEKFQKAKNKPYSWDDMKTIYSRIKTFGRMNSEFSLYPSLYIPSTNVDEHIKAVKAIALVEKSLLPSYRMTIEELPQVLEAIQEKIAEKNLAITKAKSDEHFQEVLAKSVEEKEREAATRKTVAERVKEFARLNYLLDCYFEVDNCDLYGRGSDNAPQPSQAKSEVVGEAVTDTAALLQEAIESLQIALEFSDNKQQLQEAIEALEVAKEFL